jgi:magnesium transporter
MITRHVSKNATWVDLESPTQDEIREIAKEYHLNPLVVHELSAPTLKPKVDLYDSYLYLILHFPRLRREHQTEQNHEIDFVVGKKFLITVRFNPSEPLHLFAKMFEANVVLGKSEFGTHAGYLFFHMIGKLYESTLHELASIKESLRQIEDDIFGGQEREMVICLSKVSRDLLDFKRSLSLHRDILQSFEVAGRKLYGEDFVFHLRTLIGDYYRVEHALESSVEFLKELRETNNSLLSTKQNEIMKTLTILAFSALPATAVLSLFQVDSVSRPIVGSRYDFWILVLLVLGIASALYIYFKRKKWL